MHRTWKCVFGRDTYLIPAVLRVQFMTWAYVTLTPLFGSFSQFKSYSMSAEMIGGLFELPVDRKCNKKQPNIVKEIFTLLLCKK